MILYVIKIKGFKKMKYLLTIIFVFIFMGCSTHKIENEYNKPAEYWASKIEKDIKDTNIDQLLADFTAFSNEHKASKEISEISLKVIEFLSNENLEAAIAMIKNHQQRYVTKDNEDYLSYLLIESRFKLLDLPNRLQVKIDELIEATYKFEKAYPESAFNNKVVVLQKKLKAKRKYMNLDISALYERIGKSKASEYYFNKADTEGIDLDKYPKETVSWYRYLFEGDGSETWISYFVPRGVNVVSEGLNEEK